MRQLTLLQFSQTETILTPYGQVTVGQARWVHPDVANLLAKAPADTWPWELYTDDGSPVVFNSVEELLAATMEEK